MPYYKINFHSNQMAQSIKKKSLYYSYLPNKRVHTPYLILVHLSPYTILFGPTRLLFFEKKPLCIKFFSFSVFFHLHDYLALHDYLFLTNFPLCTFIRQTRVVTEENRKLLRTCQCWSNAFFNIYEHLSKCKWMNSRIIERPPKDLKSWKRSQKRYGHSLTSERCLLITVSKNYIQ